MMTRKLLSVLLSMCVLFSALLPTVHAKESEPAESTSAQNCHTMTQQWFGDKPETRLPGSVGSRVSETLANYFTVRENSYKENAAVRGAVPTMGLCSSAVQKETAQRTVAILDFEKRVGINILDAESTIRYEEDYIRHNEDGTVTVYLYEWTFFDYDDLSDNVQTVDVSGYGVYHKVTLEAVCETYSILTDEYDESDMLGICTMNQSTEDELIAMDYEPVELANAAWEELQKEMASTDENSPKTREMYASYNPDAAAAYADQYVYNGATGGSVYEGYYNSAYANFNSVGGDCANYTSQSIYAGGMPQVVGTPYGTDGWYYKTSTNRSGTWTSTIYLRTWMGNNRGTKVTASNSTVFKGSPVFYNDAHTTICVGKNSAGTPIINSHNKDVYHGVWNYWGSGTTYTTVQLTAANVQTPCTTHTKGTYLWYAAVHPHYHHWICSVCNEQFRDGSTEWLSSCEQCNPSCAPTNAWIKSSLLKVGIGESITFAFGCDGYAEGYALGIDKVGVGRVETLYPGTYGEWSISFAEAGEYSAYVTAFNAQGGVDSERISFIVYDSIPSWAMVSTDKQWYALNEKVTVTIKSDTAINYAIGLDLYDATGEMKERIETMSDLGDRYDPYDILNLSAGYYSVYVTAINNYGWIDSPKAFFCVGHHETYRVDSSPTMNDEGRIEGVCPYCPNIETVTLPKLNTTDYTKTTTKAATCTATGTDTYKWNTTTYGTFSFTATTASLGHSYTSKVTAPTCTEQGYTTHTCSRCSDSYKDTYTNATGHSYTSKVTTAATCTNAGVKTYTCSKCSHSYTEAISATGHTEVVDKAVAATCTTAGKTEGSHCSVCNAVIKAQTTVAALGHSYTSKVTAPTCTEQGYTTHTCSRCSDSYKDSYTNATGHSYSYTDKGETHEAVCGKCAHSFTEAHSYTDNACVCGAVEILAPITDENIVINHSLNLASDISINYAVKTSLLSGYDSFYMEIQVPVYNGNALTGFKTVTIEPVLNGNYYYFTMADLTAMNMNDILVATLHMNKGKQEYGSKPDSYSVATYALGLLNMNGVAEELKILGADLLRYGAAAQIYKDYRTDALATSAMTAAHKAYLSDLNAVTFGNTNTIYNDLSNPMITWAGKTMNLGSKVVVKFVFNAGVYTGDISKLTLRMIYQGSNGTYRTVTLSNPTIYNEAKRMYAFEFDSLMAAELRTPLSVAVYNGDTQLSQTMQYSADTYGNSTSGTLLELCKALFAYSDSAKAYFTK